MAKTAQEVQETQDQQENTEQADSKKEAQSVEFTEVAEGGAAGSGASLDILLDMNIPVTAAVGQTQIPVRRLLQLGAGSVLKLDKPIDEPVDLYLKDTQFATGYVVVVEGQFAVRIEQILGAGTAVAAETAQPVEA
ncbi:MAG: FliM/FliN family flagellar motor switch protein [Planctomycetota bacterium]|jgi:flagellar motor switch protein FliN/FliY